MAAETTKHRLAFDAYWELGDKRSIPALQRKLVEMGQTACERTLRTWKQTYHWDDRIAELERRAWEQADKARIAAIREMNERQAKSFLLAQQKALQAIAAISPDSIEFAEAVRALTEAAKGERLARGEATQRQEITHDPDRDPRLAARSDDELDAFLASFGCPV